MSKTSDGNGVTSRTSVNWTEKPVYRWEQRVPSLRKARLGCCSGFYVWAHLYSSRDFSATKVRRELGGWGIQKDGKMMVVVTIGFHSFHVSVQCWLVGGAVPTQRAADQFSLTMLMCAGTLEVFSTNGAAHQDTSMFMFHLIVMK